MKRFNNTFAASFVALAIGSLVINPASAAVVRSSFGDLTSVTHRGADTTGMTESGRTIKEFNRNDISAVTHRWIPEGVKPFTKESGKAYRQTDLTTITNHYDR